MGWFSDIFGGGGSSSKSKATLNTSLAINALTQNIMNCSSNAMMAQELLVSGDYNVITGRQLQTLHLSADCSQSAQNVTDLQQQVSSLLSNAANAQNVAVLGILGKSNSDVETSITNDVKQSITQQTLADIVNTVNIQQKILISGNSNIVNFTQEQTSQLVYTAAQNAINNLKSVQAINNALSQKSDSSVSNPISDVIDSVGGIFTAGGWMIVIVIVVGIVFIGPTLIKTFFGSEGGQPSPYSQMMQQYGQQQQRQYGPPPGYGPGY
jgi:hypothetical protein